MEFKITKEQILELAKRDVNQYQLKEWFPNAFKKELEVGVWYKSNAGRIVFRTGDSDNYGFCMGMIWRGDLLCYDNNNWKEATEEEVESALEKEAIKKYGEDWRSVDIKAHPNGDECDNIPIYRAVITTSEIWNNNGIIFKDGKWAEPLKEKTTEWKPAPTEQTVISLKKALKILAKKLKVSPENIEIE